MTDASGDMTRHKLQRDECCILQRMSLLRVLMRGLKDSHAAQRLQAAQAMLRISDISEDEESPLHNAAMEERDAAIREAGEAHQWVLQFRQRERDEAASSSHVNRVADQMINMLSGENTEESDAE